MDKAGRYLPTQFNPKSRKILYAEEQLSPCTSTTEPVCLEPALSNKRSHRIEKPSHLNKEEPWFTVTRGSPHSNKAHLKINK